MSRWQDPRLGIWKSAVQKYVRRGEVDRAAWAARELLALPGGRTALARRLSVIAAEDVGARWVPGVVRITRDAKSTGDLFDFDRRLVAATAALASLPKSKEAYWLAATCWAGRHATDEVSRKRLRQALEDHDYKTAVATYIATRESKQWRSGDRAIEAIRAAAAGTPPLAKSIVEAALWREGQGGSGIDELAAAAIIAVIDRPDGDVPELPSATYDEGPRRFPLDWYAADGHTVPGERALVRVARRHGLSAWRLGDLMFNASSIVLGPVELPSRWRDSALELDARDGGWGSHVEGLIEFGWLMPEIQAEIEAELARDPTLGSRRP